MGINGQMLHGFMTIGKERKEKKKALAIKINRINATFDYKTQCTHKHGDMWKYMWLKTGKYANKSKYEELKTNRIYSRPTTRWEDCTSMRRVQKGDSSENGSQNLYLQMNT